LKKVLSPGNFANRVFLQFHAVCKLSHLGEILDGFK
jgi:hypothetical protein